MALRLPLIPSAHSGVLAQLHFPGNLCVEEFAAIRVMSSDALMASTGADHSAVGFVKVRGSSSKALSALLLGMRRVIGRRCYRSVHDDGPRGPRYVAKPGCGVGAGYWGSHGGFSYCARESVGAEYLGQ